MRFFLQVPEEPVEVVVELEEEVAETVAAGAAADVEETETDAGVEEGEEAATELGALLLLLPEPLEELTRLERGGPGNT